MTMWNGKEIEKEAEKAARRTCWPVTNLQEVYRMGWESGAYAVRSLEDYENKRLKREVELLRQYGNTVCIAQADAVIKEESKIIDMVILSDEFGSSEADIYEMIVQCAEEKVAIYGHTGPWNVRKFSPNVVEGKSTLYTYAIYGE